jgi:hypothetical protein
MYAAGATFTGSSAIGSADGFAGSGGVFTGGPPDYYNINTIGGDGGEFFGGDNGGFGGYFVGGQVAGGVAGDGIYATSQDTAGYFSGNVTVIGTLTAAAKYFKIDHPLDPANKYLIHASVESPEMKNIYDGLVVLDGSGEATVVLPEWFETLNTDFRYQLTSIGAPAPNLYIAQEVRGNSFQIAGGSPGMKVSWQITGVRQDAYAKAHPLVVSVDKNERERGFYMQPDLYGLPEEKQIEWGRYPAMMKRAKELRSSRRGRTERR